MFHMEQFVYFGFYSGFLFSYAPYARLGYAFLFKQGFAGNLSDAFFLLIAIPLRTVAGESGKQMKGAAPKSHEIGKRRHAEALA